jgi:hypothetical protein
LNYSPKPGVLPEIHGAAAQEKANFMVDAVRNSIPASLISLTENITNREAFYPLG